MRLAAQDSPRPTLVLTGYADGSVPSGVAVPPMARAAAATRAGASRLVGQPGRGTQGVAGSLANRAYFGLMRTWPAWPNGETGGE